MGSRHTKVELQACVTCKQQSRSGLRRRLRVVCDVIKADGAPGKKIGCRVCGRSKRRWEEEGHFQARIFLSLRWCSREPDSPRYFGAFTTPSPSSRERPSSD